MNDFETAVIYWLKLLVFLFWCFMLAYVQKNFDGDAALIASMILVLILFVAIMPKLPPGRK